MGQSKKRPVAITGLGVVSAAGIGMDALWDALVQGRSCIGPITGFDANGFPSRLAAQVPEFSIRDWVPKHYRKATKVMARDTKLAVVGASLAAADARLVTRATEEENAQTTYPASRLGCHIGAGLIAAETDELSYALASSRMDANPTKLDLKKWGGSSGSGGMNNLPPLWLLKYLPNMLACHVTIVHGAEGPSNTITCGEASSLLSLGESARVIERRKADVCFAGGGESKLNPMGMMRMHFAGQLADVTEDDAPRARDIVQPFEDVSRGSIAGESSGLLILEALETAEARGAQPHAIFAGFGAAMGIAEDDLSDPGASYWPVGTHRGVVGAIEAALHDAGLTPNDIDLLVPQGIGVPSRDQAEWNALRQIFGHRLESIGRVDVVPVVGLSWASQGAVQAAVASACLSRGMVPGSDAVPRHAVVCSHSMGGLAGAVVLSRASRLP